jgi:hypothetical protein
VKKAEERGTEKSSEQSGKSLERHCVFQGKKQRKEKREKITKITKTPKKIRIQN